MSQPSKITQSSLPEAHLPGTTEAPTTPGTYRFQSEHTSRAVMVEVRLTNGELTVWWAGRDITIDRVRGSWRGPIPPATGPASRQELE